MFEDAGFIRPYKDKPWIFKKPTESEALEFSQKHNENTWDKSFYLYYNGNVTKN